MQNNVFKVVLSLGSNLNNPLQNISLAIKKISNLDCIKLIKQSSFYETEPIGYKHQPNFINAIIIIETKIDKFDLLHKMQLIENELDRKRYFKNSPRTLDIDIIDYNYEKINSKDLILPHPMAKSRAFVLLPLKEVEPNFILDDEHVGILLKKISNQIIKIL